MYIRVVLGLTGRQCIPKFCLLSPVASALYSGGSRSRPVIFIKCAYSIKHSNTTWIHPLSTKSRTLTSSLHPLSINTMDVKEDQEISQTKMKTGHNENETQPRAFVGNKEENKMNVIPKHVRYKKKRGGKLPIPSIIELMVIGNGVAGAPRSIMAHMNYFRYLFNCGEGTQRICSENKMKIARITDIFITHRSWDNIGGLLGMVLSLDSVNIPKLRIHGPPGVEKLVTMSRMFAQFVGIDLEKREISEGTYEDSAMKIDFVPLYPSNMTSSVADSDEPGAKRQKVSQEEDMSVVYICTPHEKPAAVSLEKCVDHGVPWGPHIGRLKNGEVITLENGTVVHPEDVLCEKEPNNPFIVVECPNESYLDSLESSVELQACQANQPGATPTLSTYPVAIMVIHLTPSHVMESLRYQCWMKRFGGQTQHLVLNGTGSPISMEGAYRIQTVLNMLHPHIFPLLPYQHVQPAIGPDTSSTKTGTDKSEESIDTEKSDESTISDTELLRSTNPTNGGTGLAATSEPVIGEVGLAYYIRGPVAKHRQFHRDRCITLDPDKYIAEAFEEGPELEEALKQTKEKLHDASVQPGNDYPEIVFLGTGSAVPNKVRNVSAILLHLSDKMCMLLDCGEDTYGQMLRHYGDKTPEILEKLVSVFITHLHADHHMGLLRIAFARKAMYASRAEVYTPLTVYAPENIEPWLESVSRHVLPLSPDLLRVVPLENFLLRSRSNHLEAYELTLDSMDLLEFVPVPVRHRQYPHGIVLRHRDGWKICYSGDTMPSHQLVNAGKGSDILIHEATMEDTLEEDAKKKKHCTTSQAISVGMDMEAKFILLTHFSQRYAKVPIFNDMFTARVGIAFDNMRVRVNDLSLLPHFTPALKAMFAEHYAEMEEKTEKHERRIARAKAKASTGTEQSGQSDAAQAGQSNSEQTGTEQNEQNQNTEHQQFENAAKVPS